MMLAEYARPVVAVGSLSVWIIGGLFTIAGEGQVAFLWQICSAIDFNCSRVRQDCDLYSSL